MLRVRSILFKKCNVLGNNEVTQESVIKKIMRDRIAEPACGAKFRYWCITKEKSLRKRRRFQRGISVLRQRIIGQATKSTG